MYDVIIIGSGVAGTTAGCFLACADKKVLILEKERLPRYKTCGGGVIARVMELLPYSLDNAVERRINLAEVYDHSVDVQFKIERNNPIIYMTMRKKLDFLMLDKAVTSNAVYHSNAEVTNLIRFDDYVEVITEGKSYKARYIIGADGATGITTNILGINKMFKKIPAIESEIFVDELTLERFSKTARFDFGIIPRGYSWVFPKDDHLSIGVLSHNNTGSNLNIHLKDYLDRLGIKDIDRNEQHGYIIPVLNKHKKFDFGRILLVGDAAGLADPLTAEGISYAVESGRYAAEAILKCGDNVELVNKNYENYLKRITRELNYARLLSNFFYSASSIRNYVMRKFGYRISNLMTDIISGEANYSRVMKNPANYLKLLSFRS
ncbi:MAG: geranylgeranyl reductase family protein [Ignavibacteria bacterium]|jgi:geranylgeranyl reductase family protein